MLRHCLECGELIPEARLKALPTATKCVKCSDTEKKIAFRVITGKTTYSELSILEPKSTAAKDFNRMSRKGRHAYIGRTSRPPVKRDIGGSIRDGMNRVDGYRADIPTPWILHPEKITRLDIISCDNAERRRYLFDTLGAKKYYELIGNLKLVDETNDNHGNPMRLYETIAEALIDEALTEQTKIQLLEVICPSTGRIYTLYPPSQHNGIFFTTAWEAKADTFDNQKIQYRHGDVGILNLDQSFDKPIMET